MSPMKSSISGMRSGSATTLRSATSTMDALSGTSSSDPPDQGSSGCRMPVVSRTSLTIPVAPSRWRVPASSILSRRNRDLTPALDMYSRPLRSTTTASPFQAGHPCDTLSSNSPAVDESRSPCRTTVL